MIALTELASIIHLASTIAWCFAAMLFSPRIGELVRRGGDTELKLHAVIGFTAWLMVAFAAIRLAWPEFHDMPPVELFARCALYVASCGVGCTLVTLRMRRRR